MATTVAPVAAVRAQALLEQLGESFVERVMLPMVRERLRAAGATASAFARAVELTHAEGASPIAARLIAWFEWLGESTSSADMERAIYGMTAAERESAEWEAAWLRDMRALAASSPAVRGWIVEGFPDTAVELGMVAPRPIVLPAATLNSQGGMPL